MESFLLAMGLTGLALLVISLFFDGVLDSIEFLHALDNDLFSLSAISAFMAGTGFSGWMASQSSNSALFVMGVALPVGLVFAVGAVQLVRLLSSENFEGPSGSTAALRGETAMVITPISSGTFGEVAVRHLDQLVKLNAKSDEDIAKGERVLVLDILSPTSVKVCRLAADDDNKKEHHA